MQLLDTALLPCPSSGVSPPPCSVSVPHPEQKQEEEILCL